VTGEETASGARTTRSCGPSRGTEPSSAFELRSIGVVRSALSDRDHAPKQGDEGAPDAWLVFEDDLDDALRDLEPGAEIIVLTWLHLARRNILRVRPRDNPANAKRGVFSTRSPDRPNPIGMHRVRILDVDGRRLRVNDMEAVDGTPIVDVKPVLDARDR
jgi:tRNA-Thr(GGU) m(6)t(6)A37 methyltransferase TsaA